MQYHNMYLLYESPVQIKKNKNIRALTRQIIYQLYIYTYIYISICCLIPNFSLGKTYGAVLPATCCRFVGRKQLHNGVYDNDLYTIRFFFPDEKRTRSVRRATTGLSVFSKLPFIIIFAHVNTARYTPRVLQRLRNKKKKGENERRKNVR